MLVTFAATVMLSMPADWDAFDTTMISILFVESAYDMANTSYRLKHPDEGMPQGYYIAERDPIYGNNPSSLRLWGTAILMDGLFLVTCMLLPPWPRRILEGIAVGFETGVLIGNSHLPGYVAYHVSF